MLLIGIHCTPHYLVQGTAFLLQPFGQFEYPVGSGEIVLGFQIRPHFTHLRA